MKKLSQREAWAKLAAEFTGIDLGLCYEIHKLHKTGVITKRVAEGMSKTLCSVVSDPAQFIWPLTSLYAGYRRSLAALLAAGKLDEARAFVRRTEY